MRAFLIFIAAEIAWVGVINPGWSWPALVPLAVWLAWLAGELHGEGQAWARELKHREERTGRVLDVAKMLRDPAFTRVHDGTRAAALRDRATWN